jgi:hypothetical protein
MTARPAGLEGEALAASPPMLHPYDITSFVIPNATQWSEESHVCSNRAQGIGVKNIFIVLLE